MTASTYLANALAGHVVGKTSYTMPSTVYVALFTSDPGVDGSGDECDYTSYARTASAGANWTAPSGGETENVAAVNLPKCTGGSNEATHAALFDASSGGNLLAFGELADPLLISNGITPGFAAGDLVLAIV